MSFVRASLQYAFVCLLLSSPAGAENARPNILFILSDNQPASIIGTYGNSDVKTPHIDQLAREGIQFNHAYAVNGMCSPTRATLMTGLMPSQHGIHSWLDDELLDEWPAGWSAVAEFRSLPLTLGNRGYATAMIGKWHLGKPEQASLGYQHWVTFAEGHTVDFWDNTVIENGRTYRVNDQHLVDFFTDKAIDYLRAYDGEQPFYLQLNYDGPYLNPPTNLGPARNRFYQGYVGKRFDSFPRVAFNQNQVDQLMDPANTNSFIKGKLLQSLQMHNDPATMANVLSQNAMVDDGVGRVLQVLRELGLEKNTLVVFSSDQGNFYGQHGLWQHVVVTKPSSPYETPINVPLIVRHAGKIPAGQVSNELVGQYDIPVTLLDYVGIDDVSFDNSPGRSFEPWLHVGDPADAAAFREAVFFEQEETRVIRTRDYAYWKRLQTTGDPALFDMRQDPEQLQNVASDPAYIAVVERLDRMLIDFFARYADRRYDLWNGGVAKGSVDRPEVYRQLYGEDWRPAVEMLPAFVEQAQ
ncbi:MAG: sulfatase-like hydrolase/transferase [Gammaproteobacteria bacterium]|nr:sulfatase-like hydrolase/transferase [Gammaproteobacteria bacterium]